MFFFLNDIFTCLILSYNREFQITARWSEIPAAKNTDLI